MLRLALITLAAVVAAAASAQEKPRKRLDQGEGIEAGKPAADFKLKKLKVRRDEKDGAVQLSSFRGKAPVLLIFGSYTWPPFRAQAEALEKLYESYKERAAIFIVYIREAHPTDGKRNPQNDKEGIEVEDPKTEKAREELASECVKSLKLSIPCLIDDMKNTAQKAYAGWPDRLYVIDKEGKVAFRGELGPRGFKPAEAEAALKKLLE